MQELDLTPFKVDVNSSLHPGDFVLLEKDDDGKPYLAMVSNQKDLISGKPLALSLYGAFVELNRKDILAIYQPESDDFKY